MSKCLRGFERLVTLFALISFTLLQGFRSGLRYLIAILAASILQSLNVCNSSKETYFCQVCITKLQLQNQFNYVSSQTCDQTSGPSPGFTKLFHICDYEIHGVHAIVINGVPNIIYDCVGESNSVLYLNASSTIETNLHSGLGNGLLGAIFESSLLENITQEK